MATLKLALPSDADTPASPPLRRVALLLHSVSLDRTLKGRKKPKLFVKVFVAGALVGMTRWAAAARWESQLAFAVPSGSTLVEFHVLDHHVALKKAKRQQRLAVVSLTAAELVRAGALAAHALEHDASGGIELDAVEAGAREPALGRLLVSALAIDAAADDEPPAETPGFGPVFGVPIERLVPLGAPGSSSLPQPVRVLVASLRDSAALRVPALFARRGASGSDGDQAERAQFATARARIDARGLAVRADVDSLRPTVVAALLLEFFTALPAPLVPSALLQRLDVLARSPAAPEPQNVSRTQLALDALQSSLDPRAVDLLLLLVSFGAGVCALSFFNGYTPHALALALGPVVLGHPEHVHTSARVFGFLLQRADTLVRCLDAAATGTQSELASASVEMTPAPSAAFAFVSAAADTPAARDGAPRAEPKPRAASGSSSGSSSSSSSVALDTGPASALPRAVASEPKETGRRLPPLSSSSSTSSSSSSSSSSSVTSLESEHFASDSSSLGDAIELPLVQAQLKLLAEGRASAAATATATATAPATAATAAAATAATAAAAAAAAVATTPTAAPAVAPAAASAAAPADMPAASPAVLPAATPATVTTTVTASGALPAPGSARPLTRGLSKTALRKLQVSVRDVMRTRRDAPTSFRQAAVRFDAHLAWGGSPPVVLDSCSVVLKAGFAGEIKPRAVFANEIAYRTNPHAPMLPPEVYATGKHAAKLHGVPNVRVKSPLTGAVITDWASMELLWEHAYAELGVDPSDHAALFTEAPRTPRSARERAVEVLFERFNHRAVCSAEQPVMAMFGYGVSTGVVLYSAAGFSAAVPVFEGASIGPAIRDSPLAGATVTSELQRLAGAPLSVSLAETVKVSHCFIARDAAAERAAVGSATRACTLPDGSTVNVAASALFEAGEALFAPSLVGASSARGLHQLVFDAVSACDGDIRASLLGNCFLSGGTARLRGLRTRLAGELSTLASASGLGADAVHVHAQADSWYSVFRGAAALAALPMFPQLCISAEEYAEHGPSFVHRKCLL